MYLLARIRTRIIVGYRRSVLFRWSRRDRFAVLIVAVTVAFLTGTALLVLAMGTQTAAIATGYDTNQVITTYPSAERARMATSGDGTVLPYTRVEFGDGTTHYVIGIPENPPAVLTRGERVRFPDPPETGLSRAGIDTPGERTIISRAGTERLETESRPGRSVIDPTWYVASTETVSRLGTTGAFVVQQAPGDRSLAATGVPFVSALPFFLTGTAQLVSLLGLATVAGGALVVVTVYSVTRMMVRDRLQFIQVLRATGAPPHRVLALFAGRGALLSLLGVAVGYAIGVTLTRAVVNIALYSGLPTSLNIQVTERAVTVLAPSMIGLVSAGGAAGLLAALPVARCQPAAVTTTGLPSPTVRATHIVPTTIRHRLRTDLLDWRALIPTTATLTVFITFVILVATLGSLMAPLTAADGATITEPGAGHPIESTVPMTYARALRTQGYSASPEILLFEVTGGEPFLTRGVNYSAYTAVSNIGLVEGQPPTTPDEAVIGTDLAAALNVSVGEFLTLGGSTEAGFTRVKVVGIFTAVGPQDDQLLVSLPAAQHLSGTPSGSVQFVRTASVPSLTSNLTSPTAVINVSSVRRAPNGSAIVKFTTRNYGIAEHRRIVNISLGAQQKRVRLRFRPGQQTSRVVLFESVDPGTYTLRAGRANRTVTLHPVDALSIERLPTQIPPGAAPQLQVVDPTGPVTNATVSFGNQTATTTANGTVRFTVPEESGSYTLTVRDGSRKISQELRVDADAERQLGGTVRIKPTAPTVFTQPQAEVMLTNSWNRTLTRQVRIDGPSSSLRRTVTLDPGEVTRFRTSLRRQPAGTYTVSLGTDGRSIARREFRVRGDDRLGAALASSGRNAQGTGLTQGIEMAFGNIQLLLGAVVILTGLMTVGSTTATFAQAVHARRRAIGIRRATGAAPADIVRTVLGDTLKIGVVAAPLALALSMGLTTLLLSTGQLTIFGVTLRPMVPPALLGAISAGALTLCVLSAVLATIPLFKPAPAALLGGGVIRSSPESSEVADD